MKTLGITVKKTIGVGDAIQFTSLPENYFRTFGRKLIDVNQHWVFDYNPYVIRNAAQTPDRVIELWNHNPIPRPRPDRAGSVYLSNAEHHATMFGAKVFLNRPRLYRFEEYPFQNRDLILLQTNGISHGEMPRPVVDHVLKKYRYLPLYQIGLPGGVDYGIPKLKTDSLWDLAELLSRARMLICMDSGPSWIAACYPDVLVKKLRTKPTPEHFQTWVPLAIDNIHAHWDDRCHQIFNPTEDDIGFTSSFLKL